MSSSKVGQLKPFMIEEKKEGPSRSVSEITANKWQGCMTANIKKEEKWVPLMTKTWQPKKTASRGFTGASAADDNTQVDLMLEYVSQYAPNALYRDITLRATSLAAVWTLVRDWAGLKTSGCKQHVYYTVKRGYDPNGDLTPTDFFFSLRNAKEDCLLLSAAHGGNVRFHGSVPADDEDLTPTLESDIVLDWLDSLGGVKLVEHAFRVFAKELETQSLADLRQRISDNLASLMTESDQQAELNRAFVPNRKYPNSTGNQFQRTYPQPPSSYPPSARPQPFATSPTAPGAGQTASSGPPCKLCIATKPNIAHTHSITTCSQLNLQERRGVSKKQVTRAVKTEDEAINEDYGYPKYEESFDEEYNNIPDDQTDAHQVSPLVKTGLTQVSPCPVVRINRVNITESPILACSSLSRTVYLVLDTGATASIITLKMCQLLNLTIYKTGHRAVQVDGESQLPVLGEVHTTFTRGSTTLHFSGLVVSRLGVDILAGTNFHVENDVYSRMSKGTIHIGDHCTLQSSPPSLLTLDTMDTRSKQRLNKIPTSTTLLPGDSCTVHAPDDLAPDSFILLEPNLQQTPPFFSSTITQLQDGSFTVKNQSPDPVHLKKNCQAFSIYTTATSNLFSPSNPHPLDIPPLVAVPLKDIVDKVTFDGNLSKQDKAPFLTSISKHSAVFQPSLPGYNHAFGPVYASFKFASKARPVPDKIRSPNYGSHQDLLFNKKCLLLRQQGVLLDPVEADIQPIMTHNSWVVKKPSAAAIPWDKCAVKDVRLVVGLDPLNKFLMDPPGKITKTESIYSALANWEYMGELDFSDFYFQIKFRADTDSDKQKLGYLCIRSAMGTLCFSSATMGLLGMDVFQDELTDKLVGDLVLSGHVIKLADNVYFGANTIQDFQQLFETILHRCEAADLRLKASKLKLNVQSADILGLHWNQGALSPSHHKLDPLSVCEQPKTVSGLRSWLGGVRFNEICLPGAKLAGFSRLLDEQIPASRSGKEEIVWTGDLLNSFQQIQNILKHPLSVTVPKRGDTVYMAVDACTSLPAGGTKLFIQRPGVQGFLPSFNFGTRLPQTLRDWSPCEVEAYFLNKGITKAEFYTRLTGNPGIVLTDCKPVFQAKQKLDRGQFSSSRRLQDLLTNLSAKRFTLQLLSAKLPSPLLTQVDFASRNPVPCTQSSCTICSDPLPAAIMAVIRSVPISSLALASVASWKEIQQSCPDLRRVHALLMSGRNLSKKEKKAADIRTYLRKCTLNKQGIIVSLHQTPFQPKPTELIVIPRPYAFTFAKALHVNVNHPLPTQMRKQFSRQYFMLDEATILQKVWDTCEVPCQASKILPKEILQFTTETKPEQLGQFFNADVMEESSQKILVIRENLTSFTDSLIIKNQTKPALKDALIVLTSRLKLGNNVSIRVDGQSSLASLRADKSLEPLGIFLDIGRPKNVNKNATAEKAIRELREQLVRLSPHGGAVSDATLARATAFLNSIVRHTGRSAKELWLSRDQLSGVNLQLNDLEISHTQFEKRKASHLPSAKYASRDGKPVSVPSLQIGDMVFVKSDRSKSKARDSYFVLNLNKDKQLATIQKFPMSNFKHHPIEVNYQNLYPCTEAITSTPTQVLPLHPDQHLPATEHLTRPRPPQPRSVLTPTPIYTPPDQDSDSEDDDPTPQPPLPLFPTPPHQQDDDNVDDHHPPPVDVDDIDEADGGHPAQAQLDQDDVDPLLLPALDLVYIDEEPHEVPPLPRLHLVQPLYGQDSYLRAGDTVALVQGDSWSKVTLTSHSGHRDAQNHSLYWNYEALDGSHPEGGYLFPGQAWGVLRNEFVNVDLSSVKIVLTNENHPNVNNFEDEGQ